MTTRSRVEEPVLRSFKHKPLVQVVEPALTIQGHPWTEATSFATGSSLSLPQLSMHTSAFPTSTLGSLTTSTMTFDDHLPQAQTKSFPSHLGLDCRARSFQDELLEQVARHDQLDGQKEDEEQHVQLQQTFRELAEYLAHLRKVRQKLRQKSAQELEKLEAQLRKHNNIATNFNNNELDEQPVELHQLRDKDRQLQNYCQNFRKLHRQLRAKVHKNLRSCI